MNSTFFIPSSFSAELNCITNGNPNDNAITMNVTAIFSY